MQFFTEEALQSLLKVEKVHKYAYGYEVLRQLGIIRKSKSPTDDRYHTKKYGQSLRYGQYGVVAACINHGIKASKSEADSINNILSQWIAFEKWAAGQESNKSYKNGSAFSYINYYKGSTVNEYLKSYPFTS
ncbi:hypothetical protein GCM10022212_28440 [Actimicrobium antarcticum]|uniref:Uncharacterized protein n=1 Tax=Actimicrobium antarcticum TaxID=1051899 RepID=A0ABP7TMZ9_9BURK